MRTVLKKTETTSGAGAWRFGVIGRIGVSTGLLRNAVSGFALICWFISSNLYAQSDYKFKEGLIVSDCHRYGREALVTDQVAFQLYSGKMKAPAPNVELFVDSKGKSITWQSIRVDSAGKFTGEQLSNAYLYLQYQADRSQNALLNISGNSMVYFNGVPHAGDIYGDGWMNIPVKLQRGKNELLIRCSNFSRWQGVAAKLLFPQKNVLLAVEDVTLPHIVIGESSGDLKGAVVVVNKTDKRLAGLEITTSLNGKGFTSAVADVPPLTTRKVSFSFDPSGVKAKGDYPCAITLKQKGRFLDEKQVVVSAVNTGEHHSITFVSNIDGSLQYYGVAPSTSSAEKQALFLSVHGAGVQAIGQARAYQPKDWGVVATPTNRRPRGFNWEDWGRLDALEVLELAQARFKPDPQRIYLTGHSMGGHGTWYLGATYPGKWAAIAPCAGYPTLTGYGSADGKIPQQGRTEHEKLLLRASNGSNVFELAQNYKDLGVYIHHGDDDQVVSVDYARQMRKVLGDFHNDFSYYEYPGGSHWFGNESVDWSPIFEFFNWHKIDHDSAMNKIDFVTANPGISSNYRWASIIQQDTPLEYSSFSLTRDKKNSTIIGTTRNVSMLRLETDFVEAGDSIRITLDSAVIRTTASKEKVLWLAGYPEWRIVPGVNPKHKNPVRSGTFKEAFNHKMVYVYGTHGTRAENEWAYNKARYDAEVWYYRGNGAVDVVSDDEFSAARFADRGVIIFGNAVTNSAWKKLLASCPIQVSSDRITVGPHVYNGRDLGAYFVWPRADSDKAMVAVISGTGLAGMRAVDANQYFAAGSGFPDYLIVSADMLVAGPKGIKTAGFFGNDWSLPESNPSTVKE